MLNDVQANGDKTLPQSTSVPYRRSLLLSGRLESLSRSWLLSGTREPLWCAGQFAQAYVIAHEIAHHVQRLLGIQSKVRRLQAQDPRSRNQLSVRIELQADCFAGVWGNSTEQRNIVDETDVAQGLNAAAAVGDDRLQRMAHGRVSPESFTHGSSAQRTAWLSAGCSRATSLTVILSRLHKFAAGGPPTSRELIQNCWL